MRWFVAGACFLLWSSLAAVGIEIPEHQELDRESLDKLESSINGFAEAAHTRRDLAQSWTQFNNYYAGIPTLPSPGNLPTYYGQQPGPCNPKATKTTNNRCSGAAYKLSPSVRAITICPDPIPSWIISCQRVDEWINCDDSTNFPGWVYLWDTDAGNIRIGGIYLDVTPPDSNDIVTPAQGFTTPPTPFLSEVKSRNQFRMTFTLSEVRLDLTSKLTTDRLQLRVKALSILNIKLSLSLAEASITLTNQPISSTQHAISFRMNMIFNANKACKATGFAVPGLDQNLNTTCIYRSDKYTVSSPATRSNYYRGLGCGTTVTNCRTESFLEGVLYDINLPRTGGSSSPTAAFDTSACLFEFANNYASVSPGASHKTEMGLTFDIGELCNTCFCIFSCCYDICRVVANAVLNLIIGIIIQSILCQLITGMFYITDTNGPTAARGVINNAVLSLYTFFKKYVETPLTTVKDAETFEDVTMPALFNADGYTWPATNCATRGYCPYPVAIDFNNSDLFKAFSLGINNILGNVSTTPAYYNQNKLTIVEVIDILTGNKDGVVKVGQCPDPGIDPPTDTLGFTAGTCDGDIKAELKLADYPRYTWDSQPIFNGAIQLNGFMLSGVNSITRLKLLDNGFDSAVDTTAYYTHTLKNSLDMTKFGVEFNYTLTLRDGYWVHRPRNTIVPANQVRSIAMTTNLFAELTGITLDADIFMLLRPDLLSPKKIGGVFGNFPAGSITDRLRCAAFALDMFRFSKLQVRGSLGTLRFQNFFGDLATVISQGTTVFNLAYYSATNLYLTFLADNWVRPFLNQYLFENTYDGKCGTKVNGVCRRPNSTDFCPSTYPYYFTNTDPNRYINFYDSRVWNVVKGVVNNVVGGIPVRTGAASINTIIDKYLDWYIPDAAFRNITMIKLPNNQSGLEVGNVDVISSQITIQADLNGDGLPDPNKYIIFSNFGVRNLETVHELSIRPTSQTQPRQFRLDFKMGSGKIYDRIANKYITNGLLGVKFHLKMFVQETTNGAPTLYTDDEADIYVQVGNLTVGTDIYALLNQNEYLDLTFGDMFKLGCLLALVDGFDMQTLTIGFQQFRLRLNRPGSWRTRDKYCTNVWNANDNCQVPGCIFSSTTYGTACNKRTASPTVYALRMSDALDHLAWEAGTWGSTVDNMVQYLFNGVAKSTRATVNTFAQRQVAVAGCSSYDVFAGSPLGFVSALLGNATSASDGFFAFYQLLAKNQYNPRFPGVSPSNPANTMFGQAPYPKANSINYGTSGSPVLAAVYRLKTGFPAAQCYKIVPLKGPYPALAPNDTCWEDRVVIPPSDTGVTDLRDSFIVSQVQKFLSKSGRKVVLDALDALAKTKGNLIGDSLISYPNGTLLPDGRGRCFSVVDGEASYCIDLDMNLTSLNVPIFSNDLFIPGLVVALRRLKVLNFHTFDADPEVFELLKLYVPDQYNPQYGTEIRDTDARFTLAHRIRFTGVSYLSFQVELDVSVAEQFIKLNSAFPDRKVTDTMVLNFQLKDLDLQMMTMTAINSTRVSEVPFYYMLDPFNPENCFFSIFYSKGLYLPQFQMYVTDIVGPFSNITAKSPSNAKPNIFSSGMADLITASLEVIFQLIKQDLPDATQGKMREYLNRVLDDFVRVSRSANNCPPPPPCSTDPTSWCHYINFMESTFTPILNTLNTAVGGNPVETSQVDINSLIELGLNYTFVDPKGVKLASSANIQHPAVGDWLIPQPLYYVNDQSYVRITNIGLLGLNSIYKLIFDRYATDSYSLGFSIEMGNGTMNDGSTNPSTPFRADPLIIQAEFDVLVKAKRPSAVYETLADNAFKVQLIFSGLNLTSIQQILVNKTDLYLLNINQITKSQCVLAIVDKVTLQTVAMHIADFDVKIPMNDCPTNGACASQLGKFGRNPSTCTSQQCNLGLAIDQLRAEAVITNAYAPPTQSVPLSMINAIFNNMASNAAEGFNKVDIWNKTREQCDVPRLILDILSGVTNSTHAKQLANRLANNVTGILKFPLPQVKPDFSSVTVQSWRLNDENDRQNFIDEVIASAKRARGPTPTPEVVLTEGSICSELNLPTLLKPLCSSVAGGSSNFSAKLEQWTKTQPNLIETKKSPSDIEDRVNIDFDKQPFYDIRTSQIVKSVSGYFDNHKASFNQLLASTANTTDLLRVETDGSVTLVVNMTDAIYWIDQNLLSGKTCEGSDKDPSFVLQDLLGTSSLLIPSFRLLPGLLEVRNFGAFTDLIVLRPYTANGQNARVTTRHEFGWRDPTKPLGITLSLDMFYDHGFTSGGTIPSGIEDKETMNITLTAQDLLIQVLTLLAVDTKELGQVRLGDFLNVTATQAFKRNCKAATCLMRGIYDGGLYIPQLTANVTNVIGPRVKTTRKLFSAGMEMLLDALLEIVVQLFRDDLPALTQGPLRETINDMLITTLADAKAPDACPDRVNYTLTYPMGQYFCSHNDTTGKNPLLTQSEAQCRAKGNGRLCKWEPPDGFLTPQTVACIYTSESKILNFKTARGLVQLKDLINNRLMNPDSSLYINNFLGAFANNLQSDMYGPPADFPLKYNGKDYGTVTLEIGKFTVTHLNTVDRLQIFDTAPYADGGSAAYTNPEEYEPVGIVDRRRLALEEVTTEIDGADSQPLSFSSRRDLATTKSDFNYADNKYMSRTAVGWQKFSFYFEFLFKFDELFVPRKDGPTDFVENHVSVKFNLIDFDVAIDLYMLVNIPRLMDLQIRSIGTIYELPCILEIFEDGGLVPTRANITYGSVGFELDCVDRCDSPLFAALTPGGFSDAASENLRKSFTATFKKITDFLINLLSSSDAQKYLDRQISISNTQCVAIKTGSLNLPDFSAKPTVDAASAMGIAGLATLFATFVGFSLLVPVHFRRRDELMKRALLDAHSRGAAGKSKDEFELAERRLKSAFAHPMMPIPVKFLVPFWILVNIVMFATANFAEPGAIVELTLSIAGDTTFPITLLPFTLPTSINDMWNAGTIFLAVLIALASGAWPYAKQLSMLFCWFAPATVLHPNARGRALEILDALGKWSLVDIYVLVMLMVGFRFYLSSTLVQSFSLLPPDVLVVDVVVTPGWGIFGFVLGAMGSLIVNHIMIWWHRRVVRMDEDLQDAILGTLVKDLRTPRIPLSRHRFNILDAEGRPYRYSVTVRVMFVFCFFISFVVLIIGAILPVIKFNFRGVAGLAIAFIDQDLAAVSYSVVSIGTSIIKGARDNTASVLGILFIQILYILFALVIPLILCVLLVGIWMVPLTLREQLLLYFVAEVLSAWEAVLVLVLSLVACILQISALAQFIVDAATGSLCSAVDTQLDRFFPDPEDSRCFDVIASLMPSSIVFIVAAFVLVATYTCAFRLIHAAIEDRELAMRRKPPHSPGEMTGLTGFLVRRSLEAFGASQVQNGGSVANLYAQGQGAFDYRESQLAPANPILAREMPSSMSGMQAPNPMFHGSLPTTSRVSHQSIDV